MTIEDAQRLFREGNIDGAKAEYRRLLETSPEFVSALVALGTIHHLQLNFREAIECFGKAVKLDPHNTALRIRLGGALRDHGQLDAAIRQYRLILDIDPDHSEALVALALLSPNEAYGEEVRALEKLYQRPDIPRHVRRRLAFTLGKIFDDLEQYDKAFEFLAAGNRIAREDHPAKIESLASNFRRIRAAFDAGFFARHPSTGIDDDCPIIIAGLPRSGTSLIEQILASHPDVFGAGETELMLDIVREHRDSPDTRFPEGFARLTRDQYRQIAHRYADGLRERASGERKVTDKNLDSVRHLGWIGMLLPKAAIIYCRRDPRDQGLSFFQQDFLHHQPYSYDLEDIARYTLLYRSLMDHWKRMLPGRVLEIDYEAVVAEPEKQIQQLMAHCGLPFDPACLSFHETERTVYTASLSQVRRPLYASSVGRWKNYRRPLAPMLKILNEGLKT